MIPIKLKHVMISISIACLVTVLVIMLLNIANTNRERAQMEADTLELRQQPCKMLDIGTLTPEILKSFIQTNNEKVYSRHADELVRLFIKYAQKYKLSPILLTAIAQVESNFTFTAVSKTGAKGIMQIQDNIWLAILTEEGIADSVTELYDPAKNIEAGCYVLRRYLDESTDLESALNKYLGDDYPPYRAKIDKGVGNIVMLGISHEINAPYKKTSVAEVIEDKTGEGNTIDKVTN